MLISDSYVRSYNLTLAHFIIFSAPTALSLSIFITTMTVPSKRLSLNSYLILFRSKLLH